MPVTIFMNYILILSKDKRVFATVVFNKHFKLMCGCEQKYKLSDIIPHINTYLKRVIDTKIKY